MDYIISVDPLVMNDDEETFGDPYFPGDGVAPGVDTVVVCVCWMLSKWMDSFPSVKLCQTILS